MSLEYSYMSTQSITLSTSYAVNNVQPVVRLLTETVLFRGYVEGFCQPTGLINLGVAAVDLLQLKNLQAAFKHYFNVHPTLQTDMHSAIDVATCFGEGLCALQKSAGFPIFEPIKIKSSLPNEFQLIVPMLEETFLLYLIDFMLEFINRHAVSTSAAPEKIITDRINGLINKLSEYAPRGTNSLRFLQAAHSIDIPWTFVAQNTFQFGYGAQSRWFDSSFTDKTPVISATLARNKLATTMLLSKAGLPVPEQYLAHNETEAIHLASKIGYPVVVKPASEDGGNGVFAKLMSDDAVKKAYQQAQKYSNSVLLEKHIMGKDYRLQVVNGELLWAVERIPAGVTGNGKSSIEELIHELNKQNKKQPQLKSIDISEDVIGFLVEQGFELASILNSGQFVPISRIANISAGGTPVGVFDKVHPDNKRLAETAANLLRLDIAGIDLIMPDIQQSYLKTTGSIIEVNAQPQLGIITAPHIYKDILLKLLPEKGRIPIVVVFGDSVTAAFIESIRSVLLNRHKVIGVANANSASINGEYIAPAQSLFAAGKSLLLNNTLDALIYNVKKMEDLTEHGLPFDACDYVFFLDKPYLGNGQMNPVGIDLVATLLKVCRDLVVATEATLDYLVDSAAIKEAKLVVALSQKPKRRQQYPHIVDTVGYLNGKKRVVIKPIYTGRTIKSSIHTYLLNETTSSCEKLLLSLGLYHSANH